MGRAFHNPHATCRFNFHTLPAPEALFGASNYIKKQKLWPSSSTKSPKKTTCSVIYSIFMEKHHFFSKPPQNFGRPLAWDWEAGLPSCRTWELEQGGAKSSNIGNGKCLTYINISKNGKSILKSMVKKWKKGCSYFGWNHKNKAENWEQQPSRLISGPYCRWWKGRKTSLDSITD